MAESALEVRRIGEEMYNRSAILADHFGDVGRHLDRAVDAFNRSVGSFESRFLVQARRFQDLGAAGGESIPELQTVGSTPREVAADGLPALEESGSATHEKPAAS